MMANCNYNIVNTHRLLSAYKTLWTADTSLLSTECQYCYISWHAVRSNLLHLYPKIHGLGSRNKSLASFHKRQPIM